MGRIFNSASSQYLINGAAVVTAEPFTMACWFNPDNVTGSFTLMSLGVNGGVARWQLISGGAVANDPVQAGSTNSGGTGALSSTSTSISATTWQHAVGVFASTTSRTSYLNGGGAVADTTSISVSGADRTLIGARINTTVGQFLLGQVAEAGIWNVALDVTEIAALAAGYSPLCVRPASLVAYWPLIGRTSPEICPKGGFDMTLTNTPTTGVHPRIIYPKRRAA